MRHKRKKYEYKLLVQIFDFSVQKRTFNFINFVHYTSVVHILCILL